MAGKSGKPGLLGSAPGVHPGKTLSSCVFVANVPVELVEKLNLHSRFSKYGIVTEVIIHRKGFAFVQFKNCSDAVAAIIGESGTYLEGRRIACELSKNERTGPPGPCTQTGKEIVIGESDDSSSNGGGGDGRLSSSRNWPSQNVGGSSSSCQETVKPSQDQSEQDWDANNSSSPVKYTPTQQSSSDHSLTLGLFVNKNKKASKLVPFKKTTKKTEKSPEKGSAAPLNTATLRSSNFSDIKFDKGVSSSSGHQAQAGPFEELWDSDFSDEFKDESCLGGDVDTIISSSLERQLTNKSKDGGWEDATMGAEQKISNSRQKVAVEVPASLISPSHSSAKAAVEVKVPASFITPSQSSPPKTAVEVKVPASIISPNHSSPKAAVEVKVPSSLINTSANSEKSDQLSWDSRPINKPGNDNNDASWDEDNEPPFVMPTGKQELHSSTESSVNKSKASAPTPKQPSKDAQEEFNWDDEEIDVVTTPPPDDVASGSNHSKGQSEAVWVEEVVHVKPKSQSVTYARVDHVKASNSQSTSFQSESVSEATFKTHSKAVEKILSVSQADKPASFGTRSIQNQDTRVAEHSSASVPNGLTSLVYSTRVTPATSVASVGRQYIPASTSAGMQIIPASTVPIPVPIRVIQSQPQRSGPPMASNFMVPVGQTTMASLGQPRALGPPPSAINCGPPPGPPPIPPPPPPQQQQTYSSVPSMIPVRAAPNITYGSVYPSRRNDGPVGSYMAYNVSMGGQPMYQQGQPVGQMMRQEPPPPTSSNQMMSSPVEPQRQRHMSGPPAPVYMQQSQVETYGPPPPPSPSPNGYATPPSPGPSNYAPPIPPSPVPVQRERHMSGPTMPYQEQQGGQTVSRMSTTYLAASGPYGTGMKNLSMSASAPLDQQMGYKRDPAFHLTDIEKGKINSEFKEALQTAGCPLDVTDNTILQIYMVLPEPIRRGIRRMGGLKTYFELSDSFDVRGDLIGLPGQMKRTPVTIQPPPGRYQPRKTRILSGEAGEFVPGEQRSRSSSTSSNYNTSGIQETTSNMKSSTFSTSSSSGSGFGSARVGFGSSTSGSVGSGRLGFGSSNQNTASGTTGSSKSGFGSSNTGTTRSGFGSSNTGTTRSGFGPSGSARSGFGSSQDTSNQGFASMPKVGARQESVTDNAKVALKATYEDPYNLANPYDSYYPLRADLQRTASVNETGDSKEKKDNNVYTLVKDEPVADDLWELDSFLTEAYGSGYYLALSKELEKQSSQATQKSASIQDKSQTDTCEDSSQSTKETSVQSNQSVQDTKASSSSHLPSSSSALRGPSSLQDDSKYTRESSRSDATTPGSVSSGAERVKTGQKKTRCAAVFNVAHKAKKKKKKKRSDGKEVEETVDGKITEEESSSLKSTDHGGSGSSDVKLVGAESDTVSVKEETAEDKPDQKKEDKQDMDKGTDLVLKTVKKENSEDLVENSVVDEKTDVVQHRKTGDKSDLVEGTQKRQESTRESVQGSEKETIVRPDPDADTQADLLAVDPDTTNEEDETWYSLKDDDDNDISPDNAAKSVQDSSQVVVKSEEGVPQDESSIKQEIVEERPRSPIHEEIIQQCKVAEVNVKEYLAKAAAKQDHGGISIGVNTDQVKTVHKGIVTNKVPKMSRVTNTVAVPKVTRCVGTFEEFEKTYYEKNIELEAQIRLLEESLEDERDKATLQKHSYQVEVKTLKDQLETLTRKKNEIEDQLKIRKRQQVSEMRKTTAELRGTDARYSAQKSKVTSLEKENACITKELSAVTRELFDLQAIMETETIRNRTMSIDETTSTEELEEVQRQFERQMEIEKEQRENQLLEIARQAELKILKMQLDNCQKSYTKIQEQGQQTYSIYANSPQISTHEKLYVNRQWSSYQNQIQEATEQLLVDYECNELLLKEGASLAELTPLQVSHLEPFTPRTGRPSSSSRGAPSPLSAGFTIPSASQQPTDTARSRDSISDTISDAGLDELKDMTSRLLQPDMDLSKLTPTSMPNLAGSAPLFSLGTVGGQQPSSVHHPYTRQSREDRLRCIQRRLGLNPDTGKPFASRSMTKSPASSASNAAAPSEPTTELVVAATAAAKASTAARNPLLGSSAFNFAMKQRDLAAKTRPSLATSLASMFKKRLQSSSSENTTVSTPSVAQPSVPTIGMPVSLYQDFPSGVTPRARSLSSPSGQAASHPKVATTHYSHQTEAAIPTRMTETTTVLPEPSNVQHVEGIVEDRKNDYEESSTQYQYQEGIDSHAGTTLSYCQETEMPPMSQNQNETTSYQTDVYQSESDYFSSPEKADHGHLQQQKQQEPQQYYEKQQQEEQQSSQEDGPINKSVEEEYEITYVFTDDKSGSSEPGKKKPYMQLDTVETNPTTEPLSTSPSIESSGPDNSQPEEPIHMPEPAAVPEVPQFPKSEAIQATRSKSPTDDHLGQRWDDLPPRLKSRVVPCMTRSGGVTLKAIGRSQSQETGGKSSGGGKRKGSGSGAAWGGGSSVSGLAPIDDADDGWTTVVGKRKKKALDIVEQQQQQAQQQAQQQKPEAPKPLYKGTGSLDKIHSALARQFPGITRKEVMDTMKQLRLDHRGSLSGVSMAVLVKEASSHIKNTNLKYMTSKPTKHEECDDICVICQDDLRVKPGGSKRGNPIQADIRMLDCGHRFHDDCLRTWYDTRERTCPICRCHTLLPDDYPTLSMDDFPALDVA